MDDECEWCGEPLDSEGRCECDTANEPEPAQEGHGDDYLAWKLRRVHERRMDNDE